MQAYSDYSIRFISIGESIEKVADILSRNREPVTSTCRMPPALTLQRKNRKPDGIAT